MSRAATTALARPMIDGDIPQVATVTAEAFETDIGTDALRRAWEERLQHSLRTDPGGSFVSERDGLVTGAAQAVIREGIWILSLIAVSPKLGEGGDGRALMRASLDYGSGCAGGLIVASDDPRALRLYASSGFALEATFQITGGVDHKLIPALDPAITPVDPSRLDTLDSISRAARGAAHSPDLEVPRARGASFFQLEDRGFVAIGPARGVWLLAARDEQAASALLWYALAQLPHETPVDIGWISGRQRWALDIFVAARLSFTTYGAIATRGAVGPLYPYIPSPPFA